MHHRELSAKPCIGWLVLFCFIWTSVLSPVMPTIAQPRPDVGIRDMSHEAAKENLNDYLDLVARTERDFDTSAFDIEVKATTLGNNPERIFAFVRDQILFEAYPGSLRGARGALESRAANSVDQSLLLAELLKTAGFQNVQLVHGVLEVERARTLANQMFEGQTGFNVPQSRHMPKSVYADLAQIFDLDQSTVLDAVHEQTWLMTELIGQLSEAATEDARLVAHAAGLAGQESVSDDHFRVDRLVRQNQRHVWVRFDDGSGVLSDLDPSFGEASFGQSFAVPVSTLPSPLPLEWSQSVKVELSLERLNGDTLEYDTLWSKTFQGSEITTSAIEFQIVPSSIDSNKLRSGGLSKEETLLGFQTSDGYQPLIRIDAVSEVAQPFDLFGRKRDIRQGGMVAVAVATAFDFFGTALSRATGTEPETKLVGLSFKFLVREPDTSGRLISRSYQAVLLDRLQAGSRDPNGTPKIAEKLSADEKVRKRLSVAGEIRMIGFVRDRSALTKQWMEQVRRLSPVLRQTLDYRYGQIESLPAQNDQGFPALAPQTLAWSLLTEDMAAARSTRGAAVRAYYAKPRLVIFTSQGTSGESSVFAVTRQFNILENAVRVIGATGGVATPAGVGSAQDGARYFLMAQGATDTIAEAWILGNDSVVNAHTIVSKALEDGRKLAVLTRDDLGDIGQFGLSPEAQAGVASDLAEGYIVVVPAAAVELAGAVREGWWRYHPETGVLLGVAPGGAGQAFSEWLSASNVAKSAFVGVLIAHVVCAYMSPNDETFRQCLREAIISEAIVFGGLFFFPGVAAFAGGSLLAGAGLWTAVYGLATNNPIALGVGLGFLIPGIGHALASPSHRFASPMLRRLAQEADELAAVNRLRPALAEAGAGSGLSRILRPVANAADENVFLSRVLRNTDEYLERIRNMFPRLPAKPPIRPYGQKVIYGRSTNLSKVIVDRRKAILDFEGRNYAVIEYLTDSGARKTVVGRSPGFMKAGKHGEKTAWNELPKYVRDDPSRITRVFTELEPCKSCRRFLDENGVPRSKVRYGFDYPSDNWQARIAGKKAWREALDALQGT